MKNVLSWTAAAALVVGMAGAAHAQQFLQDFEINADDWFAVAPGSIGQVPSDAGTLGVTSAGGSAGHGEIFMPASGGTGSGAFTRFGGYSGTWPGFIRQKLDIYIDPAAGSEGDGWFLDNAVTCSELARTTKVATLPNCDPAGGSGPLGWLEAGGVGAEKTGAAEWSIAADADGGAYPGGGIQITTPGWYTVVSHWGETASNTGAATDEIDRNTFIYDSSGTLIYSNLNPNQHLLEDAGGWRYGWMGKNTLAADTTVAVDNSTLLIGITETQLDHFQCYDARSARG